MNASELMAWEIDQVGNQVEKALAGLTPEQLDARVSDSSMSPEDVLAHLGECYAAAVTEIGGGRHAWGTFKLEGATWDERLASWRQLRAKARETATSGDDGALKAGFAFIVNHDGYHVGQLCHLRLHLDPDWDYMTLYR